MQLTVGKLLQGGKYLINHPLESQGFGITYRATQTVQGQPVVIKTLHPALHKSRAFSRLRDRFIDLSCEITRCQHPSVVNVLELFQENEWPFMVMEYVSGQSLAAIIQSGQPMAEIEALHYIRHLGAALMAGHGRDIVHGNLKPQNIIRRTGTNVPVVIGYGISAERMLAAVQYAVPGFPHEFTAPEQVGESGDRCKSADLYGLAAIFYFLLCGHPPRAVSDAQDWQARLPLLSLLKPNLQQILLQGLAVEAPNRISIEDWLNLLPIANNPVTTVIPRPERFDRRLSDRVITPLPDRPPVERRPVAASPTQLELSAAIAGVAAAVTQLEAPEPVEAPVQAAVESPVELPVERAPTQRPRFRQQPLPEALPTVAPPAAVTPAAPARPRLRTEPQSVPLQSAPPLPLVPPMPDPAEQQLRQRPLRPYAQLPLPTSPSPLKKMLVMTGGIAAALGLSFGLALRFTAARSPGGASLFHAEQTFPNREWQGTLTPGADENVFTESGPTAPQPSRPTGDAAPRDENIDESRSPEPATGTAPVFDREPMIDPAAGQTDLPKVERQLAPELPVRETKSTVPKALEEAAPAPPKAPSRKAEDPLPPVKNLPATVDESSIERPLSPRTGVKKP
jgi:eukaryotic-like serine/threonine-protein kinase